MAAVDALSRYAENIAGAQHSKANQLLYARAFLGFSSGEMTRATVLEFLKATGETASTNPLPRHKKVSQGTRAYIFRVIRGLFAANEVQWPFGRGKTPPEATVKLREQDRPALHPMAVRKMVFAARAGELDSQSSVFLALSTIYGMRKVEIAEVQSGDLDLPRRLLSVAARKGGIERVHLIPESIVPYLEAYPFDQQLTPSQGHYVWRNIEQVSGIGHVRQMGFHSIRRMLDTLLNEKLPLPIVRRFLRWQGGEEREMTLRYHSVQVVGHGQAFFSIDEAEMESDRRVMNSHPFLPFWEGKESWAVEELPKPKGR